MALIGLIAVGTYSVRFTVWRTTVALIGSFGLVIATGAALAAVRMSIDDLGNRPIKWRTILGRMVGVQAESPPGEKRP